MNRGADWDMYVVQYLAMAPTLLVLVVGVVLTLRNLPKYPRPCWAILAALALSAFNSLGLNQITQTVVSLFGGWSALQSAESHRLMMFVYTFPHSLISAVCWGLVLFAVFDRPPPPKFLREDDPDRDILDK